MQVGHIPSDACHESFDSGNHDRISEHVIRIIEEGAKCSSYGGKEKLKQETFKVPEVQGASKTSSRSASAISKDHYLCACLVDGGATITDKCISAIQAACQVGDIPSPDCRMAFDEQDSNGKGQEAVTMHVLRLIDNGRCAEHPHDNHARVSRFARCEPSYGLRSLSLPMFGR